MVARSEYVRHWKTKGRRPKKPKLSGEARLAPIVLVLIRKGLLERRGAKTVITPKGAEYVRQIVEQRP